MEDDEGGYEQVIQLPGAESEERGDEGLDTLSLTFEGQGVKA